MSERIAQVLFDGLVSGGIYASLALALVLVYQTTAVINFAQGEMAMLSTYVCLALIEWGVGYWTAFCLTLAISYVFGAAIERFIMRRFHASNHLVEVVVLMGLLVTISSVAGAIWGYDVRVFPSPFGQGVLQVFGFSFRRHDMGALLVMLIALACVFAFLRFTMVGLAMRASAQNPASSRLCGISVSRMLSAGWGLSATVGAVSGMMIAPIVFLDPGMMAGTLTYAFAAALLGGVNNPIGAVVGGFIVGIAQSAMVALLPNHGSELKLTFALILIVTVLLIFPQGLFGKRIFSRV
jgi:branched-chain amino acid transport system permease protein